MVAASWVNVRLPVLTQDVIGKYDQYDGRSAHHDRGHASLMICKRSACLVTKRHDLRKGRIESAAYGVDSMYKRC